MELLADASAEEKGVLVYEPVALGYFSASSRASLREQLVLDEPALVSWAVVAWTLKMKNIAYDERAERKSMMGLAVYLSRSPDS